MSTPRRLWPWLLLALALAAATGIAVRTAMGPAVPVQLPQRQAIVHQVVATGRVMPPARVQLGSTTLGRATAVHVVEGDRVKEGQLLIQIDDAQTKADVAQAEAGVAQAQARLRVVRQVTALVAVESLQQARTNLEQAERQYKRVQQLYASEAVTQEQLDDAQRALDNARSQEQSAQAQARSSGPSGSEYLVATTALSQAKANLLGAQARLDETRIVAPADGVVLARDVEPGDVVQPGKVLMVLARDGDKQLSVQPDEKNLAFLRLGQLAQASADAFPDEHFEAKVIWIAPSIDPDRGTVEVKLAVEHPPPYLRADMTVSVNVEVARRQDALVMSADAVRDLSTDQPWVMVVEGNRAIRSPVKLGIRGERVVEVLEGLEPGQAVVAPSAGPLQEGARVRPRPSEVSRAL